MSEEVTLLLVGEESSGKMDIISTFIINSKRFSNRTLNNSFASAEIIIQNRNIKLNIHDVDSNFTNFENLKPIPQFYSFMTLLKKNLLKL